jgi:hypothetical protein
VRVESLAQNSTDMSSLQQKECADIWGRRIWHSEIGFWFRSIIQQTQILNSCFPETSWGLLHKFCLNPKCSFSLLPFFEHRYHIKMQTKMEYLLVPAWELTCCNRMVILRSRDYLVPVAWIRTCHHIHSSWYH